MASAIYSDYARTILVYDSDGETKRSTLIDSGNVTTICPEGGASFTLCAEKGCGPGKLSLFAADAAGNISPANPPLLDIGDVIYMIPEGTTLSDAWYCGTVIGEPERSLSNENGTIWNYQLDGLAIKLQGLPATTDADAPLYFGSEAGAVDSTHFPTRVYPAGTGINGVVNWLCTNVINSGGYAIIADSTYIVTTNMSLSSTTQVNLIVLDHEVGLATVMFDLARRVVDVTDSNLPCHWGVMPDRNFYFRMRPDNEVMSLSWQPDPAEPRGKAFVTVGGSRLTFSDARRVPGNYFTNCISLRGGLDANGNAVQGFYSDAASVAKYGRRVMTSEDVPYLRSANDAAYWAQGYFDRYADPPVGYQIEGLAITSKTGLPLPWAGYCTVATESWDTDSGGERTIKTVRVSFDHTPEASIYIGEIEPHTMAPSDGNPRQPGTTLKRAMDRMPRAKTPMGTFSGYTGTPSSSTLPEHGHSGPNDGGYAPGLRE